MDDTKKPLAVVTMVYADYPFLARWHGYYAQQLGAEHLYILTMATTRNTARSPPGPMC